MSNNRYIAMLMALGMIGACSEGEKSGRDAQNDNGSDVSVRLDGSNESGTVSINVPGLSGKLGLPSLKLDSDKVDIDGVKLYPGAELTGVDLSGADGNSEGGLTIRFQSDASTAEIRDYYLDAFKEKSVTAHAQGDGISGVDEDGKPFSIGLTSEGGMTHGTIRLGKHS